MNGELFLYTSPLSSTEDLLWCQIFRLFAFKSMNIQIVNKYWQHSWLLKRWPQYLDCHYDSKILECESVHHITDFRKSEEFSCNILLDVGNIVWDEKCPGQCQVTLYQLNTKLAESDQTTAKPLFSSTTRQGQLHDLNWKIPYAPQWVHTLTDNNLPATQIWSSFVRSHQT